MTPSDAAWQQLISTVHASGRKAALAITGGGSGAIGELLRVPGGSRLLIEAQVPYDAAALEAFLGFAPKRLAFEPDDFWDALTKDERIVRNGAKILSVRANARFVCEIAGEHGSFGAMLARWPSSDEIGLLDLLAKRGSRLGGATGQMLLRFLGWDGFTTSKDVVACLRDAGLDIGEDVKSKRDLAAVQAQFNAWAAETGLPYAHLSRICAMSIGENYEPSRLASIANGES